MSNAAYVPRTGFSDGRHARLFELLRQQSLSQRTTKRVDQSARKPVTHGDRLALQSMAAASFRAQRLG